MDVLSDVLRAVRLTGAVYFDINAREPWVAASPHVSGICGKVMPDFEHVICLPHHAGRVVLGAARRRVAARSPARGRRRRDLRARRCPFHVDRTRQARGARLEHVLPPERPAAAVRLQRVRRRGRQVALRVRLSRLRRAAVQPDPRCPAAHAARQALERRRAAHARPDPRRAAGEGEPARRRRDDSLEAERAHVPAGRARVHRRHAARNRPAGSRRCAIATSAPRCG